MEDLSGIRFQNREVSSILKICSGKLFSSTISLSRVSRKILNTVVYAVRHWLKRRYAAHDRTWNCILLMKTLSQCVKWRLILCICRKSSRCRQLQSKHPATIVGRKSGKILNNETWMNSFIESLNYHLSDIKYLQQWFSTVGLHSFGKFVMSLRIWSYKIKYAN